MSNKSNQEHNRDSLIAHIQAQDTIIRTRNNEIVELKIALEKALQTEIPLSEVLEKRIASAYKKGWKEAYKKITAELKNQFHLASFGLVDYAEPTRKEQK